MDGKLALLPVWLVYGIRVFAIFGSNAIFDKAVILI